MDIEYIFCLGKKLVKRDKGNLMKQYLTRFTRWFIFLFSINLVSNYFIKQEPNISTALSVALGCSLGLAAFKYRQ